MSWTFPSHLRCTVLWLSANHRVIDRQLTDAGVPGSPPRVSRRVFLARRQPRNREGPGSHPGMLGERAGAAAWGGPHSQRPLPDRVHGVFRCSRFSRQQALVAIIRALFCFCVYCYVSIYMCVLLVNLAVWYRVLRIMVSLASTHFLADTAVEHLAR